MLYLPDMLNIMVKKIKPFNGGIVLYPEIEKIRELFSKSLRSIDAIGDETRQSIILALMEGPYEGMRVGAITKKTHLSRPAVSHHLKILCEANILTLSKSGTMNFYCLNPDKTQIADLLELFQSILDILNSCPYAGRAES